MPTSSDENSYPDPSRIHSPQNASASSSSNWMHSMDDANTNRAEEMYQSSAAVRARARQDPRLADFLRSYHTQVADIVSRVTREGKVTMNDEITHNRVTFDLHETDSGIDRTVPILWVAYTSDADGVTSTPVDARHLVPDTQLEWLRQFEPETQASAFCYLYFPGSTAPEKLTDEALRTSNVSPTHPSAFTSLGDPRSCWDTTTGPSDPQGHGTWHADCTARGPVTQASVDLPDVTEAQQKAVDGVGHGRHLRPHEENREPATAGITSLQAFLQHEMDCLPS